MDGENIYRDHVGMEKMIIGMGWMGKAFVGWGGMGLQLCPLVKL